MKGLLLLYNLK